MKLVFTQDGHIITHGLDYTPDFELGKRGLVSGSTTPTGVLRGNNTWKDIDINDLPVGALEGTGNNETVPTTKAVIDYIGSFVKTAETLRFSGIINCSDGSYTTIPVGGTEHQGLPRSF